MMRSICLAWGRSASFVLARLCRLHQRDIADLLIGWTSASKLVQVSERPVPFLLPHDPVTLSGTNPTSGGGEAKSSMTLAEED
jgi:hypothetical protein